MRKKPEQSKQQRATRKFFVRTALAAVALLVVFPTLNHRAMSTSHSRFLQFPSAFSTRATSTTDQTSYTAYIPAESESYILSHSTELKLDVKPPSHATTCHIWNDNSSTPYHKELLDFHGELKQYFKLVDDFNLTVTDVRHHLNDETMNICQMLELHPSGIPALFPSGQISLTRAGFVEPLLPQMRHPDLCLKGEREGLFNMDYMLHDFAAMCHKLKPASRIIFVDLGASLSFHSGRKSPAMFIIELYRKFGFPFDHIYAYEMRQQAAEQVINLLPRDLLASYHWINVGVESDPNSKKNPFSMLLDNYNEDDLIVVKLDVDTPVLERELADQLLGNPKLLSLVDQFYFEHHVNQQELARHWGASIKESVDDTLKLFRSLRENGVASHYWV